jgi:hypothetical protein
MMPPGCWDAANVRYRVKISLWQHGAINLVALRLGRTPNSLPVAYIGISDNS